MSQTELAQLVGVRRETIGHLENGHYNPSLVLAAKIAKVFNQNYTYYTNSEKILLKC